jgi:DNA-binding transcriptional MerR regulator
VANPTHPDDGAMIWNDSGRAPRPPPRRAAAGRSPVPTGPPAAPEPPPEAVPAAGRILLREAADRYGVSVSTLRSWARSGQVDGVLADTPAGRRWLVVPASVAERVAAGTRPPLPAPGAMPEEGGAMLVPRAAWDRLMDQLGNLHESGQQLAEARERAARYETEAKFLRERLAELRREREALAGRAGEAPPEPRPPADPEPAGPVPRLRGVWDALWGRRG